MRSMTIVLAALLVGSPLLAQGPGQGRARQGMGMGQGQGMMGGGILGSVMAFAPDKVLEHAEHLGLTPDQVSKLTALKETTAKAVSQAHEPARAAHMSLNKVLKETPDDTAAVQKYFMAHHLAEGNMQWLRASAAFQARALLTAEQRTMLEGMAKPGGHDH